MEILQKAMVAMAAAVLGWLLFSLPKVMQRTMTWTLMLSSIGLAAVVGFVSNSILGYLFPAMPEDVKCSIAAVLGAYCDQWMLRYSQFMNRAADKVEDSILGSHEHHHDSNLNEGPPDGEPK